MGRAKAKRSTKNAEAPAPIRGDQALAVHYGVTPKTVYAWRQAGLPCEAEGRLFLYRLADTDPWVDAHRQLKESEGLTPASRVRLQREKAKLRQERLKAAGMQRDEDAATGNVLRRDEWELFAVEVVQQARDRFMRLPKMLCKHVPQKYQRVLQREGEADVRKICVEMARALAQGVKD